MQNNGTPTLSLWNNDDDLVIAASPNEASKIMQARCGCDGTWRDGHDDGQLWEMIADDRILTLSGTAQTVEAWISEHGTGWMAARWSAGVAVETTHLSPARSLLEAAA